LALAELLALSLWVSASAVLPALKLEWELGDGGGAALTIAVQAGFIVGTLASALANLPDIVAARTLMVIGAALGALANGALALGVASLGPALALRFVTGVCLAGAYPPAMKIMATWFRAGRGLACFGYLGHMWELYAMWTWIAAFLAASLEANGGGSYVGLGPSGATFLVVALGALGCWAGGVASDRWGRTALTMVAMALSGTCA